MNPRLETIARRRGQLIAEIAGERVQLRVALGAVRQRAALAGLGLMAGRLVARYPWMRLLAVAGFAAYAARHVLARLRAPDSTR